jgi:hypothetical protein
MENKQLAQGIASLGRYGDTTLMHMRPDEVNQLTAISRANGGDITINPDTGMPEAFLGNFISALAPTAAGIAAGAFFPPAYAPYLAAGAGGLTAYAQGKRDPLGIAMGALGGYGGGTLGQNLAATGGVQVPAGSAESTFMPTDTTIGGANLTSNVAGATGTTGTTGQIGGANLSTAGARGITATTPTQVYKPINTGFGPNMGQVNNPFATPRDVALDNEAFYQIGSPTNQLPDIQPDPNAITKLPPLQEGRPGLFEQGYEYAQNKFGQLGRGVEGVFTDSNKRAEFFGRMGGAQYDEAGNLIKAGSEGAGMLKTALPFAGAGLEAYQKGIYEDMPTYEASTAGRYDPSRVLNLGMDTGLRLLARGGEVKRYQAGGNIMGNPVTTPSPYLQQIGMFPASAVGGPPPEYGIVDVGGNFVKTSDKPGQGLMSKTSYYETYKFKEPGYTAEANKEQGDGGDFDSKAGIQPQGGAGVDPALALQAAQGYAESQQSNLDEQGLGTLKTGGSVRRFQMGGTTAERNMYGSQDTNEPTGLGTLTTAEQNLPGRMGMAGSTDLQNATTAEQNIAREPMQEAGTVVSSPMQNTMGAQPNDMASRLPMGPTDMNANVTESLGQALQSNPQGFTVIPNQSIPPTSGEAPMMAMGGRVRYAEGGISALTPDDGKMLNGNGDGVSDDIPAMIEGEQEAALSDGEFIVPARIVSELGNGSSDAGAKKLYAMIDRIQAARQKTMGDNKQYAKDTNAERFLPV